MIKEAPDDSKVDSSVERDVNEEDDNNMYQPERQEEEDSEVVITTDQLNERVSKIISKLKKYMEENNKTIKGIFKNDIFEAELDDAGARSRVDVIELKTFIPVLQQIGIELDNIDMFCIYTKLKIVDDFEVIGVDNLMKEFESHSSPGKLSKLKVHNEIMEKEKKDSNSGVFYSEKNAMSLDMPIQSKKSFNLDAPEHKADLIKDSNGFDKKEVKFTGQENVENLPEVNEDDENFSDYDFDNDSDGFISGRIEKDGKEINEVADDMFVNPQTEASKNKNNSRPTTSKPNI